MSRISFLWQISKTDIQSTLKNVCKKVLHDRSAGASRLAGRHQALKLLGAQYKTLSSDAAAGLEDLLHRVGVQSGIFGSDAAYPAAASAPPNTEPTPTPPAPAPTLSLHEVLKRLADVDSLSVKELRLRVEHFNCDQPPIEKKDLQHTLRLHLLQQLEIDDLKSLLSTCGLPIQLQVSNLNKADLVQILSMHSFTICPS